MTFVCVCVCLCGLRGPLDPSGFSQLLPSQTTCPLVCCSLPCFVSHSQPKIFALDVPFVLPKLAPNLPKEEFLLIFGFSSSAICTVGPCLKTPVLSVIVSKTFYYFHRLIAIYIHTVSPRMKVS